jgi:hypothetical protein
MPPKEGNKKMPPKEGNRKMPPKEGNRKTPPKEGNRKTPPREGNNSPPSEGSGVVSYRLSKRSNFLYRRLLTCRKAGFKLFTP